MVDFCEDIAYLFGFFRIVRVGFEVYSITNGMLTIKIVNMYHFLMFSNFLFLLLISTLCLNGPVRCLLFVICKSFRFSKHYSIFCFEPNAIIFAFEYVVIILIYKYLILKTL